MASYIHCHCGTVSTIQKRLSCIDFFLSSTGVIGLHSYLSKINQLCATCMVAINLMHEALMAAQHA
jgi:hypothetical protein